MFQTSQSRNLSIALSKFDIKLWLFLFTLLSAIDSASAAVYTFKFSGTLSSYTMPVVNANDASVDIATVWFCMSCMMRSHTYKLKSKICSAICLSVIRLHRLHKQYFTAFSL